MTLHRLANTWYTGANVPGKPQTLMPYTGASAPIAASATRSSAAACSASSCQVRTARPNAMTARSCGCSRMSGGAEHAGRDEPAADRIDGAAGAREFVAQFNATRPPDVPLGEVKDWHIAGR